MRSPVHRVGVAAALILGWSLGGCGHVAEEPEVAIPALPNVPQEEDPPFAFPVLLSESQVSGTYFFTYGGGIYRKKNYLTGAQETTILILADAHGVTRVHGIETWFDGWGRPHALSVLRQQLEYNRLLTEAGYTASFRDQNLPDHALRSVPVTGILDPATLAIPVERLRLRLSPAWRKAEPGTASVEEALRALDRCDAAIAKVPLERLQENPAPTDHSHYEGHFAGGLTDFIVLDEPDSDALKQLKKTPEYAQYFREHELYGLTDLELPTDRLSEPPPYDRYSAEYFDYKHDREYVESREAAMQPVPLGYGWPRADEAYVRAYVDPAKVNPDVLAEVDRRIKEAEAAVAAAESALGN